MTSSFAARIVVYFATLFLVAMGTLFTLWLYGFPAIGLQGASSQKLTEAMRVLNYRPIIFAKFWMQILPSAAAICW